MGAARLYMHQQLAQVVVAIRRRHSQTQANAAANGAQTDRNSLRRLRKRKREDSAGSERLTSQRLMNQALSMRAEKSTGFVERLELQFAIRPHEQPSIGQRHAQLLPRHGIDEELGLGRQGDLKVVLAAGGTHATAEARIGERVKRHRRPPVAAEVARIEKCARRRRLTGKHPRVIANGLPQAVTIGPRFTRLASVHQPIRWTFCSVRVPTATINVRRRRDSSTSNHATDSDASVFGCTCSSVGRTNFGSTSWPRD